MYIPERKKKEITVSQPPSYKMGGIIAAGVGHNENNSIGDKGIPLIPAYSYHQSGGKYIKSMKLAEVESEEIVFNVETAQNINRLVEEYEGCGCPDKLVTLGKVVLEALSNTKDQTCKTGCKFKPKLEILK